MPSLTLPQALDVAREHHRAGRLAEAEALYGSILAIQPDHAEALHLLGLVDLQRGHYALGAEKIERAVAANPNDADALCNLGEAYRMLGLAEKAAASYRRAIEIEPEHVAATYNLGHVLRSGGQGAEAIAAYRRTLQFRPGFVAAWNSLGEALGEERRWQEAIACFGRALELKPDHADTYYRLAMVLAETGQTDAAIAACQRALTYNPDVSLAENAIGSILAKAGRFAEAMARFEHAVRLNPGYAEAHSNLGEALRKCDRPDDAAQACQRAIELAPNFAPAYCNFGAALTDLRRYPEAIAAFRRALEIKPDYANCWNNLGGALTYEGRLDESAAACHRALEINPNFAEAHGNLGSVLINLSRFEEAMRELDRALDLEPGLDSAKFWKAAIFLLHGDFARGWPMYEARWGLNEMKPRVFSQPRLTVGNASGKRVLVHAEQGFGDAIQFVRYAPLIAKLGGEVIVECRQPLVELFRGAQGVSDVTLAGEPLPPLDVEVPMLSQPLVFGTMRESIPKDVPYLSVDPARREAWRGRMAGVKGGLNIGLAWAGNPRYQRNWARDIPLEKLCPLLRIDRVRVHSFQLGKEAEEIRQVPEAEAIVDHTDDLHDFADTAAFMAELDLIISVDTAVAHLAGALARPVWILLAFVPDWRWGLEGETTPWYPTMRLFRQPTRGDWDSVVQRVSDELKMLAAEDR